MNPTSYLINQHQRKVMRMMISIQLEGKTSKEYITEVWKRCWENMMESTHSMSMGPNQTKKNFSKKDQNKGYPIEVTKFIGKV